MRKGQGLVENDRQRATAEKQYNNAIRQVLTQQPPTAMEILRHLTNEKVQLLNPELRQFYENYIVVSSEQALTISIANESQRSDAWLRQRSMRITASNARSQYTYNANPNANWDTRFQELYHSTLKGNEDTTRRLCCKGPARDVYEENTNTKVYELSLVIREELPWLSASLDGVVVDDQGRLVRTLEIKTVTGQYLTAEELVANNCINGKLKTENGMDENGKLKTKTDHYGQVQIGMLLSGLPECD